MSEEKLYYTDEEVQADFRRFLSPKAFMRWPVHVILRHDSIENWEKCDKVPMNHEIVVIDYPDGNIKTVVGDGKSKALDCKELVHPISVVNYIPNKIFLCDDLSKLKNIPFHSKDSIKIFLDNYSIEFDETNSFPKYLFRGRNECVGTLTGDNLISELCNKILELSSKGEKNERTE